MILLGGSDAPLIEAVYSALPGAERLGADEVPGSLLARIRGKRARLVWIDAVARLDRPAPSSDLSAVVRAASAGGARKLVLVTSRAKDDPQLVGLRRSGIPYDIVRIERLLDIEGETAAHLSAKPRIIVPPGVLEQTRGAVRPSEAAAAVRERLEEPSAGRTIELEPIEDRGVLDALERIGARPVASRWRAALWRLAGVPRLTVGASGLVEIEREAAAPLEEPAAAA